MLILTQCFKSLTSFSHWLEIHNTANLHSVGLGGNHYLRISSGFATIPFLIVLHTQIGETVAANWAENGLKAYVTDKLEAHLRLKMYILNNFLHKQSYYDHHRIATHHTISRIHAMVYHSFYSVV